MSEGMGAVAPAVSSGSTSSTPSATASADGTPKVPTSKAQSDSNVPTKTPTKHKVKIDGQELEVEEEELRRGYTHAQAANKRFQEAAAKEKEAKEIMSKLESGDIGWLANKLGKDKAKELFENFLIDGLEEETLKRENPGEYRARQLEAENKKLKADQEAAAEKARQERYQETARKAHEDLDNEVHQALSKLGRKPTPRIAMRVVDEIIIKMEGKKEKITADQASQLAIKGIKQDIAEFLPGCSIEELREILPQEVIDKLRQSEVEKYQSDLSKKRTKPSTPAQKTGKQPKSIDDWFDALPQKINRRR